MDARKYYKIKLCENVGRVFWEMFENVDGFGSQEGSDLVNKSKGLSSTGSGMLYRNLGYDEIALSIDRKIGEIDFELYDGIVVIVRGGSFLGHCVSYRTGLPVYYLEVDRRGDYTVRFVNSMVGEGIVRDKRLLLCEDISGQGYTLDRAIRYLESFGNDVDMFVVCEDSLSRFDVDYVLYSSKGDLVNGKPYRFLLPWERYQISSLFDLDEEELPDHYYERKVYDHRIRGAIESLESKERLGYYSLTDLVSDRECAGETEFRVLDREYVNVYAYLNGDVGFECDSMIDYIGKMGITEFVTGDYELGLRVANRYRALRVSVWLDGSEVPVKVG